MVMGLGAAEAMSATPQCLIDGVSKTVVTAQVVALDAVLMANRLGAQVPGGMIYALATDVQPTTASADANDWTTWQAGQVALKNYKRPRPLVLRVNRDQCLNIEFRNLLNPMAADPKDGRPAELAAGVFVQGLNWASPVPDEPSQKGQDDASWVGENVNSLVNAGATGVKNYLYYAQEEGTFLLYSTGDDFSSDNAADGGTGAGGQLTQGLFGAVNVQPGGAQYYRSQVNAEDLCLASTDAQWSNGECTRDGTGLPQIDYAAVYPQGHPRQGMPILAMVQGSNIVHSDLTAIITGPDAARFPDSMAGTPPFNEVVQTPDRLEPYREFTIIYHELLRSVQAFSPLYNADQLKNALEAGGDNFAINYGMGGIGSEIIANRLQTGPMAQCTDCKYEEFFLSSWPNGDPAMIVDNVADAGCSGGDDNNYTTYTCDATAPKATKAFFPDDPSNVYHSYLWDHTKFRVLHGGVDLHHLHHLHAHQWQRTPNSSFSSYLDSQAIGPGSAFTLEMVYNGGGNKNLTVGDSIFHCHFYPHFAAGMWALWRVHDVFEAGTALDSYPLGTPVANARALPDGEITAGTPIPGLVPLPTKAMAPEPAPVKLVESGSQVEVCQGTQAAPTNCLSNLAASAGSNLYSNPGYPFFIPGIAGSRATHPPLDFALACSVDGTACDTVGVACPNHSGMCEALDGGLPRHVVLKGGEVKHNDINPLDFSKDVERADAMGLAEEGTAIEQVAMQFHAQRTHPTRTPDGSTQTPDGSEVMFITNGNPAAPGAPYAEPCIDIDGDQPSNTMVRDYWAVDIQTAAVYNKEGWHYPQQRMISLWGDAWDFLGLRGPQKAPEPFFIRANSGDCVHYRMANLVPKTYELDDFQVRTPTDVLGQHIHLVKFDVTASDGAANGFNYEDGTFAPDEVIERINAFNNGSFTSAAGLLVETLDPKFIKYFGADANCASTGSGPQCSCTVVQEDGHYSVQGGRWCGSQATFQKWYVDPQLTNMGEDKTMRTVFTHDHFSPSTHQQTGLYAGLVAEPADSVWLDNEDGSLLGNRTAPVQNGQAMQDGGPTSWQAVIQTADENESYREFLLEFQDTTLMYRPFDGSVTAPDCPPGTACGFCSTDHSRICVTNSNSELYYGKVCQAIALPVTMRGEPIMNDDGNPVTVDLEPSCNFIAGIPSKNSLFNTESVTSNIWANTDPDNPIQAIG